MGQVRIREREEGGANLDMSSIVREREERHGTFPLLSPLPSSPSTFPPTKKTWGGSRVRGGLKGEPKLLLGGFEKNKGLGGFLRK